MEGGLSGVGLGLYGDAALQEEIDDGVAAVFTGPQQGALHLRFCGISLRGTGLIEESLDHVEAPQASGSLQVEWSAAAREKLGGVDATVGEAGVDQKSSAGVRGGERCAGGREKGRQGGLIAG